MPRRLGRALAVALTLAAPVARAGSGCQRAVELRFAPVGDAQIAVWIEDASGTVVDTLFVTRSTGLLGLANRPGNSRFRSDYRFPYGSREMVLPVWAWARGVTYPRVVMGGALGFDDNNTIGYHFQASSPEPFYCSPLGGVHRDQGGVDTVSCASPFFGSKGRFAQDGSVSHYPPRADLTSFLVDHDADDARSFASYNDLVAVSGATPPGGMEFAPPLRWSPPDGTPDGTYRARVEVSLEGDFNAAWPACTSDDAGCAHPTFLDEHAELQGYGHDVLGQPSMVWTVPFTLDEKTHVAMASDLDGYGAWDGTSGVLHAPDSSISTDVPGSGADRVQAITDGDGTWRVKVTSLGCDSGACLAPAPVTNLALTPSDTSMAVRFAEPDGLVRPMKYEVRYTPMLDASAGDFTQFIPADAAPMPSAPGATISTVVSGLKADTGYTIGVRAVAACGKTSQPVLASETTGAASFAVLHGCFVATAAWGTPLADEVGALRRLRDRRLLGNAAGALFVASYYAFSPSLARVIAVDARLRAAVRRTLAPLVALARVLAP